MENINLQTSFYRSPHDKKNPFVMINRGIFEDDELSLKAKGLLGYFLSLPDGWNVCHAHLIKKLKIGETALNSAISELISAGYAKRTREKTDLGRFTNYRYEISEFKLFLPNGVFQAGFSRPENQVLINKEEIKKESNNNTYSNSAKTHMEKKSFDNDFAAAVFSCLEKVDIPEEEKLWLTKHYSEDEVSKALEYCNSPHVSINTSFIATLKWACKTKPKIPVPILPEQKQQQAKKTVRERWGKLNNKTLLTPQHKIPVQVYILSEYIEFASQGKSLKVIPYDLNTCIAEIEKYLKDTFGAEKWEEL